jgi:hypothetical protein
MARQVYKWNKNTQEMELVYDSERKEVNAPFVIQDTLKEAEVSALGTGFISESKSQLKREAKAHGVEVTRGNSYSRKSVFESLEYRERQEQAERYEDTTKAYHDVKNDRVPFTEYQKEIFKRENEKCQQYKRRMKGY